MKLEVEQKKEEYDFKYIKRKFDYTAEKDNVYLEPAKLDKLIRQPQIQKRAEDLLNLFQNHQFSFNHEQCLQIYKRVAKAIPSNIKEGGEMAGSAKFAFRFLEDPRFADRRMQNLLRKLSEHFSKYNAS